MSSVAICEELDFAIDGMFTGVTLAGQPQSKEVRELLNIAVALSEMPRHEFKSRLGLELGWRAAGRPLAPNNATSVFQQGSRLYPVQGRSFAYSAAFHSAMAAAIFLCFALVKVQPLMQSASEHTATMLQPYIAVPLASGRVSGGGGGDHSKSPASHGELPRMTAQQISPPVVQIENLKPRLAAEPTVVGPPDTSTIAKNQLGDPLSKLMLPSNGTGIGGGIGSGEGGGVGSGRGGPGIGTGIFHIGNGVSAPRPIFTPEPEYSDEARQAKFQGIVSMWAVIGSDGHPRSLRIVRSLGMGLDEKALEAVRSWRFEPGMKDGHAVAVEMIVEVDFHLF
ncbi:MAG TPA: energy transducer TonB [Candidatus Angelobacter sp.]|jgi:TonB family protein|nr:energy transducer TonB [Candidatus Angelobacter sp.]